MKVFPQAMARGNIHIGTNAGKLYGQMPTQTPWAWRTISQSIPRATFSNTSPLSSSGMPQAYSTTSMPRRRSPLASTRFFPCSREMLLAKASNSSSRSIL